MRLAGITFAKQYPNPAEPVRGLFVEQQVRATSDRVAWRVIAPVPWAPPGLRGVAGRPKVPATEVREGISVAHPAYIAGPGKLGYQRVAHAMAGASRRAFAEAAEGASFVHAHAVYPPGAAALELASSAGVPVIVTVHGSDLYEANATPALRDLASAAARDSAAFVTVSAALAADAAKILRIEPSSIRVIPDAYRDDIFNLAEREPVAPGRPVRLVCVGRLETVKGQDVLIEALGALVDDGYNLELSLIGEGSQEPRLRELVTATKLGKRVHFLGALPPEAVRTHLANSDLYVQPSRREGFGVALVEALATGLPAVATRSGGPAEIVGPDDGVLANADDALSLAEAIIVALERLRLAEFDPAAIAGRMQARYSSVAVAEALVALYNEVASGPPTG